MWLVGLPLLLILTGSGGIAGAGGGLVASVATCPLDVVKTKLQAQRAIQGELGYLGVFGVSLLSTFANSD